MEKDLISFNDAKSELAVDADQLKRMVSEGEIRAYRDEGEVKFRREDIRALKESLDTEPTISIEEEDSIKTPGAAAGVVDLHNEPSQEFMELTAADFRDEVEIVAPSPTARDKKGKPGRPLNLEDTVTGGQGDTVTVEPDEEETFVLAEDEEEGASKTIPLELIDEEEHAGASTAVVGVSEIQTPDMLGMPRVAVGHNPLVLAVMVISTAILLWGALLVISLLSGTPMGATQWFAHLF